MNNTPKIPEICKDCAAMIICRANVVIREYGAPIATCNLNLGSRFCEKDWYGVYEACEEVVRKVQLGEPALCEKYHILQCSGIRIEERR